MLLNDSGKFFIKILKELENITDNSECKLTEH